MAETANLELFGSKTLHNPADASLLAYCPSMELLAVGTQDKHVFIFRLNGQRVYGAGQKNKATTLDAQKLAWKPNGVFTSVATYATVTDTFRTTLGLCLERRNSAIAGPGEQQSRTSTFSVRSQWTQRRRRDHVLGMDDEFDNGGR